ncbi:hypothetical protein GC170_18390 [bacterium]|nr:hypothetical protein [bacterium]
MMRAEVQNRLRARRAAQALILWEAIVLIGICAVTSLAIWHLRRRSSVIREQFRPRQLPPQTRGEITAEFRESIADEAAS